jgi:hypothetical protein
MNKPAAEVEIKFEKLKMCKWSGIDQIPVEVIQKEADH